MSKLQTIKSSALQLAGVSSTKQLKKIYPHLTAGLDLRTKAAWLHLHSSLQGEITIASLVRDELNLKTKFIHTKLQLGATLESAQLDWVRICLGAQVQDIRLCQL